MLLVSDNETKKMIINVPTGVHKELRELVEYKAEMCNDIVKLVVFV